MRTLLVTAAMLLAACATTEYRSPGPYQGGPLMGKGIYLQDVKIEPKHGKELRFEGVFRRDAKGVSISGLSPFGTTVFRLTDDFVHEPKLEVFAEELKNHGGRVLEFYRALRPLLLLDDKPASGDEHVTTRHSDQRPRTLHAPGDIDLEVREYDHEGRVGKFSMKTPLFEGSIQLKEFHPL